MNGKRPLTRSEAVRLRRKREEERALVTRSLERPARAPRPAPLLITRNVTVDAATVRCGSGASTPCASPAEGARWLASAFVFPRGFVRWRALFCLDRPDVQNQRRNDDW